MAACGSDPIDRPPPGKAELEVVKGAGTAATFASSEALTAGDTVEAIGVSAEGHVLVVFADQLHELSGTTFHVRSLYAGEGDPNAMGAVHRIAPRIGGEAWIGAEAGLFALDDLYTYKVPLLEDAGAIRDAVDVASGTLAGLWLAADGGLYRRNGDDVYQYGIEGLSGGATRVAVTPSGAFGVAVIGDAIATLEPTGDQILVDLPPLETGAIRAIAAGSDAIWVGAERGLFSFTGGADPAWKQYTLAESGALEVLALSIDAPKNAVWARTADSVVKLEAGAITSFSMAPSASMSLLTVDAFGDVWIAAGDALARNATLGGPVDATYATDVLPWIQENCSLCHRNQTQNFEDYQVFVTVAESALARVRAGDMPRCNGGVRCPSEQHLQEADYAVLEQWIRNGMPE